MGFKLFILFTTWVAFLALYWTRYTQPLRQKGWLTRLALRYGHQEHPPRLIRKGMEDGEYLGLLAKLERAKWTVEFGERTVQKPYRWKSGPQKLSQDTISQGTTGTG